MTNLGKVFFKKNFKHPQYFKKVTCHKTMKEEKLVSLHN